MGKKRSVTSADEWMYWYEAGYEKCKALQAEVERLEEENVVLQARLIKATEIREPANVHIKMLKAKVARLEQDLEWIRKKGGVMTNRNYERETMKRIIESDEVSGFDALLGESITLFCLNYIYTGKLVGVNDTHLELSGASIVYETGGLCDSEWKDAQPLPHNWCVQLSAIESWGLLK